jgi:hypothetical protein
LDRALRKEGQMADEKKVKIVYIGSGSGVSIDKLGIYRQKRGEPFDVPEAFAKEKIEAEPDKWKLAEKVKPEKAGKGPKGPPNEGQKPGGGETQ